MSKSRPEESRGGQGNGEPADAQNSDPPPASNDPAGQDQDRPAVVSPNSSDGSDPQENSQSSDGDLEPSKEIPEVLRYEVQQRLHFRGPYPHPEILKGYEEVLPGSAQMIFERAGKEQELRHELAREQVQLEHQELTHGVVQGYVGQACAFLIAMTAIGGGIYLIAADKSGAGLASIISALLGLVIAFVSGKYLESKALQDSSPRPEDPDSGSDS